MISGVVARHTLTRERPTRVDDGHGNKDDDWSNPDSKTIPGWAIDAGSTTEDNQNREGDLVQYTARGPIRADVREGDRIIYDGAVYAIQGGPVKQPGPSALTSHMILQLVKWGGR